MSDLKASVHEGTAKVPDRHLKAGERWFVAQTQPHRERFAAGQLGNQGFRTFVPLWIRTLRHARRLETRLVPLFPGYVFVVLDLDRDRWRSVNGTFGVQRLVMAGGHTRPSPMPPGIVETLMNKADDRGCLRSEEPLNAGQVVRILSGPLSDSLAELLTLDDAGRVRVLVEILGGRIPATLSRSQVMAAG